MTVRGEGYSSNASCALNYISTFLLHKQYAEDTPSYCTTIGFSSNKNCFMICTNVWNIYAFFVFNAIFNNISAIFYENKTTENLWKRAPCIYTAFIYCNTP